MGDPVDVAVTPNGITYDITPYIAGIANSVVQGPITILRVVGYACAYLPINVSGAATIGLQSVGVHVQDVGPTGLVFDGDLRDPAFAEDSWMYIRSTPVGSFKLPTDNGVEDVFPPNSEGLFDVKVGRRLVPDEQSLLLQIQCNPIPSIGDVKLYLTMALVRVLWRISAAR